MGQLEMDFVVGMPEGHPVSDVFIPKNNSNFGFNYNSRSIDKIFIDFSFSGKVYDIQNNGDGTVNIVPGGIAYYAVNNSELFVCKIN